VSDHEDPRVVAHSLRFRHVSTAYANRVALAYDRDLNAAIADDAETVAARVAKWELANGIEPKDWPAIGRNEGHLGIDIGPSTEVTR
jgi:hypothetical protein